MDLAVENFKKDLQKQRLKEVYSIDKCDVILFFFPIISRAGTDIDAAMMFLDQVTGNSMTAASKPVITVVLHLTHDPDKTIPDSNDAIKRENTTAVDCLFFEDHGLLKCQKNEDAVYKTEFSLKRQGLTSFCCIKKWDRSPPTSTPTYAENTNLITDGGSNCTKSFCDFIVRNKLAFLCFLVIVGIIIVILSITL